MKLIYSLHIGKNKNRNGEYCGFKNQEDLLNCLLLSAAISGRHFSSCELYCDSEAADIIKEDGRPFPFTNIHVCFDELGQWLMPHNWAYAKILTYLLQDEPFVHLDFDAIIWDGMPPELLKKKFVFYQKERITGKLHTYYAPLYATALRQGLLPKEVTYFPDFAMNMGLFACTDKKYFPFIKYYGEVAKDYILRQQDHIRRHSLPGGEQCILFEQLFITNMLLDAGYKEGIDFDSFISSDFNNRFSPQYRFSHFIASWKRKEGVSIQVRRMLQQLGLEKKRFRAA